MRLLIISTLQKEHLLAEKAICYLAQRVAECKTFYSDTALGFVDYKMKNVIDRTLPMATMYTRIEDGQTRHVPRYKKEFRFGLLYAGNGNQAYLTHWMSRFCLNFHGISLGAFPIEAWEEVSYACSDDQRRCPYPV